MSNGHPVERPRPVPERSAAHGDRGPNGFARVLGVLIGVLMLAAIIEYVVFALIYAA